jgi:hypothetical protein
MQFFNLTDLARNWSAMKHAATRAPVGLTERNRPRFVLMAVEDYERLNSGRTDGRRAFRTDDIPSDLEAPMLEGLERLIHDGGA